MIGQMSIVGGQQTFMMNYFRHIDKSKFHVDFLGVHGYTSPYEEEIKSLGSNLYYWNDTFAFKELFANVTKLIKFIKEGNYDVVHSNIYIGNCWFLVAAKFAGVKIRISHSHCTFPLKEENDGWLKGIYHSVIQKNLLLWASTKLLSCGIEAGKSIYGSHNFTVVNNSIDITQYYYFNESSLIKIKEEFNIKTCDKVYASISRFDENKNLSFAINVFKRITEKQPDSVLLIGGAEPYEGSTHNDIAAQVKELNLVDKIRILQTRKDLKDIFHIVDCWMLPSFHEGLPIIGIELQAAGTPIIASSSITKEMDMGLGLVSYASINNEDEWAELVENTKKKIISIEQVKRAYSIHGYNIEESVHILENIYLGE